MQPQTAGEDLVGIFTFGCRGHILPTCMLDPCCCSIQGAAARSCIKAARSVNTCRRILAVLSASQSPTTHRPRVHKVQHCQG